MSVRINTCSNNMLEFMRSLKMPHLFWRVDLLANELPMNIIPSIQFNSIQFIYPDSNHHHTHARISSSPIFILQSEHKITMKQSASLHIKRARDRERVYFQNLLQTHLHNVSIVFTVTDIQDMCWHMHTRTHTHT